MQIVEPDLDEIGRIVDRYNDPTSEAWSRYHETGRGQLKMEFWKDHFEWKFVAENYKPCIVFDYGCGTGHLDVMLADVGFTVLGYDPNKTNREVAKYIVGIQPQDVRDRLLILDGIPNRTQWSDIDLVFICHVLEHVSKREWGDFFSPIVSNDWKALISAPLGMAHYVPSHVNFWYSARELQNDLESIGLTVNWAQVYERHGVIRAEVKW